MCRVCKKIGMPEARIILSQCAIYLACSEKSNSSYLAINKALKFIKENGLEEVPIFLQTSRSISKKMRNISILTTMKI